MASAHDLSDGGLAVAAAECCIATMALIPLGAELEIPASSARLDRLLFAEGGARILVSVPAGQNAAWQQALVAAAVPAELLGVVTAAASLVIRQAGQPLLEQSLAALEACYEQAIPRRMGEGARAE